MAGSATQTARARQSRSGAGEARAAANEADEAAVEATIRERAYQLWEAEGRPTGRHEVHWLQAEQELGQGLAASSAAEAAPRNGAGGARRASGAKASRAAAPGAAGGRGTTARSGSAKTT